MSNLPITDSDRPTPEAERPAILDETQSRARRLDAAGGFIRLRAAGDGPWPVVRGDADEQRRAA